MLQARFQDALFFYNSDLEHQLEDFVPALANITFQRDLGSILDKSRRVESLIPQLAALTSMQGILCNLDCLPPYAEIVEVQDFSQCDISNSKRLQISLLSGYYTPSRF